MISGRSGGRSASEHIDSHSYAGTPNHAFPSRASSDPALRQDDSTPWARCGHGFVLLNIMRSDFKVQEPHPPHSSGLKDRISRSSDARLHALLSSNPSSLPRATACAYGHSQNHRNRMHDLHAAVHRGRYRSYSRQGNARTPFRAPFTHHPRLYCTCCLRLPLRARVPLARLAPDLSGHWKCQ